MLDGKKTGSPSLEHGAESEAEWAKRARRLGRHVQPGMIPFALTAIGALAGLPALAVVGIGVAAFAAECVLQARRTPPAVRLVTDLAQRMRDLDPAPVDTDGLPEPLRDAADAWNADWALRQEAIAQGQALVEHARALPPVFEERVGSITRAADRQEEAVEETASLVANMRQSMSLVSEQVEQLLTSSDESASAILELGGSIEEVATNTAKLHEVVDASTSSVHQMGASIRQVASGADQVGEMADETAASVTQMDRSIQEVSTNATEAAALTERAAEGASAGREAVRATIRDIEQISTLTSGAMERLDGLVRRIFEIGSILQAIDEINDETNLLSLNAAIIAAQAGEQGKAFLVVANHVKTLARRTASSTQDIERLIARIQEESTGAVDAMRAGIDAVAAGVDRSRDAGSALESIQDACTEASERVGEIARATAEQSRNSKGVAEATQRTSSQIQQITEAIGEQRRASEAMLTSSESALASCLQVHRSTDEQRQTSHHITSAIGRISDMIREIGSQTRTHSEASEAVSASVISLLDNAQAAGADVGPLRQLVGALDDQARTATWPGDGDAALAPPVEAVAAPDTVGG